MHILCTNDDGYLARGLNVLASAANPLGRISIVAPDREQSATSNSLTLHHPLRARRARDGAIVVDGTPTDCVILAVGELLDQRPDFVLSGVNHGSNMGEDVLYSGTVAAAIEATILGIPAVAVSYVGSDFEDLPSWEGVLTTLLGQIVGMPSFPPDTLLSINLPAVPATEVKGVRVTSLGKRRYRDSLTRALDPSGREYFWIGGGVTRWTGAPASDFRAVEEGYVSVTPLHLDLTNYALLEEVGGWGLELPSP
jgi:5'-nucleotidase